MGAAQLLQSLPAVKFCAVAVESPFATFREIAYDRPKGLNNSILGGAALSALR